VVERIHNFFLSRWLARSFLSRILRTSSSRQPTVLVLDIGRIDTVKLCWIKLLVRAQRTFVSFEKDVFLFPGLHTPKNRSVRDWGIYFPPLLVQSEKRVFVANQGTHMHIVWEQMEALVKKYGQKHRILYLLSSNHSSSQSVDGYVSGYVSVIVCGTDGSAAVSEHLSVCRVGYLYFLLYGHEDTLQARVFLVARTLPVHGDAWTCSTRSI